MVMKIQNFHQALTRYINNSLGLSFQWGVCDCVTYAVGAIEVMIGREMTKPTFDYTTREGALELAKTHSLEEEMLKQLGAYEVPHRFHQAGDIAIVKRDSMESVHIVFDRRAYAPVLDGTVQALLMYKLYELCPDIKILRFD